MKERKYYRNEFATPITVEDSISNSFQLKSATNDDESFALILLKPWNSTNFPINEKMWIFTELDGFKELSTFKEFIRLMVRNLRIGRE